MRTIMRKALAWVVGIVFVATAIILFVVGTNRYKADTTTMSTIMPNRFIAAGETLTSDNLRVVIIPNTKHSNSAITDANVLIGKVAITSIGVDEEIVKWKITDNSYMPNNNSRLVSYKVDLISSVSNMVRRGDIIDVYVDYQTPRKVYDTSRMADNYITSLKVLENVRVGSAKSADSVEVKDVANTGISNILNNSDSVRNQDGIDNYRSHASAVTSTVALVLNDEQINALATASSQGGNIRIALPNQLDRKTLIKKKTGTSPLFEALSRTEFFGEPNKVDQLTGTTSKINVDVSLNDSK